MLSLSCRMSRIDIERFSAIPIFWPAVLDFVFFTFFGATFISRWHNQIGSDISICLTQELILYGQKYLCWLRIHRRLKRFNILRRDYRRQAFR